jgi:hypothetical protein
MKLTWILLSSSFLIPRDNKSRSLILSYFVCYLYLYTIAVKSIVNLCIYLITLLLSIAFHLCIIILLNIVYTFLLIMFIKFLYTDKCFTILALNTPIFTVILMLLKTLPSNHCITEGTGHLYQFTAANMFLFLSKLICSF